MIPKLRVPFEMTPAVFAELEDRVRSLIAPDFWISLEQSGLVDLTGSVADSTAANGIDIGEGIGLIPAEPERAATDFDGATEYVSTPYEAWVPGSTRTFMALLDIDEIRDYNGIFGSISGGTTGLLGTAAGDLVWKVDTVDATFAGAHILGPQFLALVADDPNNTAKLYLNGELVGEEAQSATYNAADDNLAIGYAAGAFLLGRAQQAIVVDGEVEPAVIRSLYSVFFGARAVLVPARAKTVEQDSKDEIAQCVYAILATQLGSRTELPEFGLADQTFRMGGVDFEELRQAVEDFEPRAEILTESEFGGLVQRVKVNV